MIRYDISRVLEATDIVSVVGEYVRLIRAGNQYKGLCPFHNERTPSFLIHPDKQYWYCHAGCGGGNAIGFIERIEGWRFSEALKWLAERAGITGQEVANQRRLHSADREEAALLAAACDLFWERAHTVAIERRNEIRDLHRMACDWVVENAGGDPDDPRDEQSRQFAWLVVDLVPVADDWEYLADLIRRARPCDLMEAFLKLPESVRQRFESEIRWQKKLERAAAAPPRLPRGITRAAQA